MAVNGKDSWVRDGRQIFSMLLGVLLTNLLMWVGGSPSWYYSFLVDALIFALAYLSYRILVRIKRWDPVKNRLGEGTSWILGVLQGGLLTIGIDTLQAPANLEGTNLIWSLILFTTILIGAIFIVRLDHALKPSSSSANRASSPHSSTPKN